MNFAQMLSTYAGRELQFYLLTDTIVGVLISVNANVVVVRVAGVPGYSGPRDITILISSICYVRVLSV